MKKFYETLRSSFNPVTWKHYEKTKVFENLEDAIAYAKRYSRDCGKCHFTDMLIFECTPRADVYETDAYSADMLRSSDECKQIYVATCCDGVLRACNTEAEQTSESSESEEADTAHASSTLYKGSDGKLYSVQEASYMAEGLRSWFACRCYHDAIYGKSWCKLHAEELKASNLTAAKREASRKSGFFGTVLVIGTELSEDGFIKPESVLTSKIDGEWEDYEC